MEYQAEFERVSSYCERPWPEPTLISTFISGLREEIQADIRALCPTTLEEAFEKAVRMEQKHRALKMLAKTNWGNRDGRFAPRTPVGNSAVSKIMIATTRP